MKEPRHSQRRGTVLIIVVGILAVMMLLAATLALTSRIELKAARNYEYEQNLARVMEALEKYCAGILTRDKFSMSGVPYSFEKGAPVWLASGDVPPVYPARFSGDDLDGDNESFDSYDTDEFLARDDGGSPGCTEQWSMFNWRGDTNFTARLFDTNAPAGVDDSDLPYAVWKDASSILGEGNTLSGANMTAEFALYIRDVGGSRIDTNSTGNVTGSPHAQNQGLSSFESRLAAVTGPWDNQSGSRAAALINARQGAQPGGTGDDNNLIGTANLDINADGIIDTAAVADEPTEFVPENPLGDDQPFGPVDLFDLLWGMNSGSRVATILYNGGAANDSVPPGDFVNFTTHSGGTIIAARSLRGITGATGTFVNTEPVPGVLGSYPLMRYGGGSWLNNSLGQPMMLRRAAQNALASATPDNLYSFVAALGPVVVDSAGAAFAAADAEVILRQTVLNLFDMVDPDSDMRLWPVGGRTYCGVEVTPYIAEVEAAVDTSVFRYLPNPATGNVTTPAVRAGATLYKGGVTYTNGDPAWVDNDGDRTYNAGDVLLTTAVPAAGATRDMNPVQTNNNPPTGWGKYIKLVNPWNVDIDLTGYKLVLPAQDPVGTYCLRQWKFVEAAGAWQSGAVAADITIPLTGKVIPARGHFVVVDNAAAFTALGNVPAAQYLVVPEINYMQEAGGGIASTVPPADPSDDFEGLNHGPTVVKLLTSSDAPVMQFTVQDGPEDDEDAVANTNSTQIGDPRPCWLRDTTDDATYNPTMQSDLWAMGPMNILPRSSANWSGDTITPIESTKRLGWFNANWMGAQNTQVASGDKWFFVWAASAITVPTFSEQPDSLLFSFPPVDGAVDSAAYSGVPNKFIKVMNAGGLPTPGYIGFVHTGIPWCTVSLTSAATIDDATTPPTLVPHPSTIGAAELVYLRNFTDYLMGPVSPFENNQDDDNDGVVPSDDDGTDASDRGGPEIRLRGRLNVNTAPQAVMRAAFENTWMGPAGSMWPDPVLPALPRRDQIINVIELQRRAGTITAPFSSVDDLMDRVPEIFEVDVNLVDNLADLNMPNSFRREALARFMYNMVTVRTDVYSVVARVRLYIDANVNGQYDTGEEILAERGMFLVLDRSYDPVQLIINRDLPY